MRAFDTAVIFQAAVIDDLILGSAIQHFKEDVTESINFYILNNELFLSRFIKTNITLFSFYCRLI